MNSIATARRSILQSVRPPDTINADFNYFHAATTSSSSASATARRRRRASLCPATGSRRASSRTRGKIARIQREVVSGSRAATTRSTCGDTFTTSRLTLNGRPALRPPEGRPTRPTDGQGQRALPRDPARPRLRRRPAQRSRGATSRRAGPHLRARRLAQDAAARELLDLHRSSSPCRTSRSSTRSAASARIDYRWNDLNNDNMSTQRARSTSRAARSAAGQRLALDGQPDRPQLHGAARQRVHRRLRPRAGAELLRGRRPTPTGAAATCRTCPTSA